MSRARAEAAPATRSRRERRKHEVRQRIFDAAVELFTANGYEETTLDEIAERADVARATVYNHFARKRDILSEWGAENRARVRAALQDAGLRSGPPADQLNACFDILAAAYEDQRATARVVFDLGSPELYGASTELAEILADLLAEAQRAGRVRAEVDVRQVGMFLRASYLDTVRRWSIGADPPPFDLRTALRQLVEIVTVGICP